MTSRCHLTKAPQMKYIDDRYQSRPTPLPYRAGRKMDTWEWMAVRVSRGHCVRSMFLIRPICRQGLSYYYFVYSSNTIKTNCRRSRFIVSDNYKCISANLVFVFGCFYSRTGFLFIFVRKKGGLKMSPLKWQNRCN